jgi:multiple sugar transport system substrate-binding protein
VLVVLATSVARAADLVVWWEQGFNPEEDQAVREMVAAFEQKSGKRVELVLPSQDELTTKALDALKARHLPDLLYGQLIGDYYPRWAQEGRLVDLTDALGPLTTQLDRDALATATLFDATAGRRGLYVLPLGLYSHHVHVWRNLLEQAGFRLEDIPKQWEAFWSF